MIERLRVEHGAALLAFEWENRAYFVGWVPDRGDEYLPGLMSGSGSCWRSRMLGVCHFHVMVGDGGEILGRVNLVDVADGAAELGFRIAQKAAGRGLGTWAVREVCGLAGIRYGLTRLDASAAVENVGSRRVLDRVGFELTGEEVVLDGQPGVRYALRLLGPAPAR